MEHKCLYQNLNALYMHIIFHQQVVNVSKIIDQSFFLNMGAIY